MNQFGRNMTQGTQNVLGRLHLAERTLVGELRSQLGLQTRFCACRACSSRNGTMTLCGVGSGGGFRKTRSAPSTAGATFLRFGVFKADRLDARRRLHL